MQQSNQIEQKQLAATQLYQTIKKIGKNTNDTIFFNQNIIKLIEFFYYEPKIYNLLGKANKHYYNLNKSEDNIAILKEIGAEISSSLKYHSLFAFLLALKNLVLYILK